MEVVGSHFNYFPILSIVCLYVCFCELLQHLCVVVGVVARPSRQVPDELSSQKNGNKKEGN